jgi:hypothetical protein
MITDKLTLPAIARLYLIGSCIFRLKLVNGSIIHVESGNITAPTAMADMLRFLLLLKPSSLHFTVPLLQEFDGDTFSLLYLMPSTLKQLKFSGPDAETWFTQYVDFGSPPPLEHRNATSHSIYVMSTTQLHGGGTQTNIRIVSTEFFHFNFVSQFPNLTTLEISDTHTTRGPSYGTSNDPSSMRLSSLTNDSIRYFPPSLTSLFIQSGHSLTSECHKHLPRHLISFSNKENSMLGLNCLQDLPTTLEYLQCSITPLLKDSNVSKLPPKLKSLICGISTLSMEGVSKLPNTLTHLTTQLSSTFFPFFNVLPSSITSLELSDPVFGEEEITRMPQNLKTLILRHWSFGGEILFSLLPQSLENLSLYDVSNVKPLAIQYLPRKLKTLKLTTLLDSIVASSYLNGIPPTIEVINISTLDHLLLTSADLKLLPITCQSLEISSSLHEKDFPELPPKLTRLSVQSFIISKSVSLKNLPSSLTELHLAYQASNDGIWALETFRLFFPPSISNFSGKGLSHLWRQHQERHSSR